MTQEGADILPLSNPQSKSSSRCARTRLPSAEAHRGKERLRDDPVRVAESPARENFSAVTVMRTSVPERDHLRKTSFSEVIR
ncbi:MAG: hypothetical protein RLZZ450_7424 [Pseudomonadota bacterium]|jgi:hypothetical protein